MKDQKKAVLLALLAVLLWSTAGSAFKLSLRYTTPIPMLLLSVIAAVVVLIVLQYRNGGLVQAIRLSRRQWLMSALMGFLNPFLYYAILFVAYDRLLAQEALVLNYLWPVLLVLLSIPMLGQRLSLNQGAGILVSFAGMFVIATQGDFQGFRFTDAVGVGLAAGSALIWALYWILNMKDKRESLPKLLLNFSFGLLYILLYFVFSGEELPRASEAWLGSAYIGLFEMGITFVVWLGALKLARNTASVSNLIFLSPLISLFWVSLTVGEAILPSTMLGLALILGGIGIQNVKTAKSDQRSAKKEYRTRNKKQGMMKF